jgi:hypothetical protein
MCGHLVLFLSYKILTAMSVSSSSSSSSPSLPRFPTIADLEPEPASSSTSPATKRKQCYSSKEVPPGRQLAPKAARVHRFDVPVKKRPRPTQNKYLGTELVVPIPFSNSALDKMMDLRTQFSDERKAGYSSAVDGEVFVITRVLQVLDLTPTDTEKGERWVAVKWKGFKRYQWIPATDLSGTAKVLLREYMRGRANDEDDTAQDPSDELDTKRAVIAEIYVLRKQFIV